LVADTQKARDLFRQRRFGEPMEKYLDAFAELECANKQVIGSLGALVGDPVNLSYSKLRLRTRIFARHSISWCPTNL